MKLARREVEKPWGRTILPPAFADTGGRRIGEIRFETEGAEAPPLLVKYIFTGDKLSVQVHPDDAAARARGLPHGKSECWYIVAAEADARLGLGLTVEVGPEALRDAALDGSIERMLDWKSVEAGDFLYVPAGTVHAIGGGLSLVEIQQNCDVTYRLFDYGRPRELHVEDAVAVAKRGPWPETLRRRVAPDETAILVEGPPFTVVHTADGSTDALADRDRWIVPLAGRVGAAGPGDCLLVRAGEKPPASADAKLLVAAAQAGR